MIQVTGIWQNSFGVRTEASPNVIRLTASLMSLRDKVEKLTSKIAESLPNLTVHDITHLDALWEVACDILSETTFP